jgi:hypothetical protein
MFTAPVVTQSGFEVRMTNGSSVNCDVVGPAKVVFLDSSGRRLDLAEQPSTETPVVVVLVPGAAAVFDFEFGTAKCATPAKMVVITVAAGDELSSPGQVCAPLTAHPVRLAG